MGLFFFFYTFVFDNLCKGVKTESPIFLFFVLFALYPLVYFKLIRNSFTYPRMGYVNIKEEITTGFSLTVILPLIILPIATYLIVWVLKDFPGVNLIIKWMAPAFGLIFAALYFSFAQRFGKRFFYVLMVFSVIAASTFSGSIFKLTGSISTNTGVAPHIMTVVTDEINVNGVTIISSPGPQPNACVHRKSPLVPLLTVTACFIPIYFSKACSNSRTFGPKDKLGVLRTWQTASISASVTSGRDRNTLISMIVPLYYKSGYYIVQLENFQ